LYGTVSDRKDLKLEFKTILEVIVVEIAG